MDKIGGKKNESKKYEDEPKSTDRPHEHHYASTRCTSSRNDPYDGWGKYMGSGIALGLAAIGAGYSQGSIGSAAVGMLAEDGSKFGPALIFTALPESIVILGALPLFL